MADKPFLLSRNWQEQQWRADRKGAHPLLLEFEKLLIRRLKKLDVPMFTTEVNRSEERQRDLKAMGNSNAGPGQSPHQYGCAFDLVHSKRGWDLDRKQWLLIGHEGKHLAKQRGFKITWGGDFLSLWDPAHWELTEWREVKRLIDSGLNWPNAEAVHKWQVADRAARKRLS